MSVWSILWEDLSLCRKANFVFLWFLPFQYKSSEFLAELSWLSQSGDRCLDVERDPVQRHATEFSCILFTFGLLCVSSWLQTFCANSRKKNGFRVWKAVAVRVNIGNGTQILALHLPMSVPEESVNKNFYNCQIKKAGWRQSMCV